MRGKLSNDRGEAALVMLCLSLLLTAPCVAPVAAQSSSATLLGTVVDGTGAVLADVNIVLQSLNTSLERRAVSTGDGTFVMSDLPPDRYVLKAGRVGFSTTVLRDIVLNVRDRTSVRIELALASLGDNVTVQAEAQRVSTSSAVGTVVDRQFLENIPLNGRSLQSLLELTPGIVLTRTSNPDIEGGQFSVNGQRTNTNYFTVDGVSANVGISSGQAINPGQSGSGQLPATTALGGTNGLVSIEALQEFRVETSSYAPEFGRMPGGQVSLVTRSGTNSYRGTISEYFRDDALDATNWFTNRSGQSKAELRQHDFGLSAGGPLLRDRIFVFGAYEGLRLRQPQARIVGVPTTAVRLAAVDAMRLYLDALPLPNGRDLSPGFAEFSASYSDPSRFDSSSVRIDSHLSAKLSLFGRVAHAPSERTTRLGSLSYTSATHNDLTSTTLGATWIQSDRIVHSIRLNYSSTYAPYVQEPDSFGGAVPPPVSVFGPGRGPENGYFAFAMTGGGGWLWGIGTDFKQRQINVVDTTTFTSSNHEWKIGFDFRRVNPLLSGSRDAFQFLIFNTSGLSLGRARSYQLNITDPRRRAVAFDNLSLFAQDNWKPTRRLTLSYGLRWEFVPPPHSTDGPDAITLDGLDDPYDGTVKIATQDTPLWNTRYSHFAPRVGGTYVVSEKPGEQLVIKSGFGVFYDLGFGQVASSYRTYPFVANKSIADQAFPLSADALAAPILGVDPPQLLWVMDRNLRLPFTYQWNVSGERSIGSKQTLTVGYVGAAGRRLLKADRYNINLLEWPSVRTPVNVNRNRGYSDYDALQIQFQRRLHKGLQALMSYTFGRSRDTASSDVGINIPSERLPPEVDFGFSDYDVRHVLTAAATYEMPHLDVPKLGGAFVNGWSVDVMFRARSGFPINITTNVAFPPDTETARPNVVPGQPYWIPDPEVPGGQRLNRAAFVAPPPETQGDLLRGAVRGFTATQLDVAVRRQFRIGRRVGLQIRGEIFNVLNQPNFADPSGSLASGTFGASTMMLASAFGGLNAVYQIGGPRSTQLAVKLSF